MKTFTSETIEASVGTREIAAIHLEIDDLMSEHDTALGKVLRTMQDDPNVQVNLFAVLEIVSRQSDLLHLLDREVRLIQEQIQPEVELAWQVGCD